MVKKLNVLSTFDGYSSGRLILKELNIPIKNYFSSEICPKAIKVSKDNFDDVIQIGSMTSYLNQNELEKSLCLPIGYTKSVSRDVAAGLIGNAWNIKTVKEIMSGLCT